MNFMYGLVFLDMMVVFMVSCGVVDIMLSKNKKIKLLEEANRRKESEIAALSYENELAKSKLRFLKNELEVTECKNAKR